MPGVGLAKLAGLSPATVCNAELEDELNGCDPHRVVSDRVFGLLDEVLKEAERSAPA